MFTGVVNVGLVQAIEGAKYAILAELAFLKRLKRGGSVAVNGVCLTVVDEPKEQGFTVEVMPETVKRTMLSKLQIGDAVNLELPMSVETLFGGHIVQGHVDGVARLEKIERQGNSRLVTFDVDSGLTRYMIEKGFVAVNGMSLTIIAVGRDWFRVGIIPYTWKHTMLRQIQVGDAVNIEVDIMAKYLEKFIGKK